MTASEVAKRVFIGLLIIAGCPLWLPLVFLVGIYQIGDEVLLEFRRAKDAAESER